MSVPTPAPPPHQAAKARLNLFFFLLIGLTGFLLKYRKRT